jgi:hypothetical protein
MPLAQVTTARTWPESSAPQDRPRVVGGWAAFQGADTRLALEPLHLLAQRRLHIAQLPKLRARRQVRIRPSLDFIGAARNEEHAPEAVTRRITPRIIRGGLPTRRGRRLGR